MAAMSLNWIYMLTDCARDTWRYSFRAWTNTFFCEVVEEERGQEDKLPGRLAALLPLEKVIAPDWCMQSDRAGITLFGSEKEEERAGSRCTFVQWSLIKVDCLCRFLPWFYSNVSHLSHR